MDRAGDCYQAFLVHTECWQCKNQQRIFCQVLPLPGKNLRACRYMLLLSFHESLLHYADIFPCHLRELRSRFFCHRRILLLISTRLKRVFLTFLFSVYTPNMSNRPGTPSFFPSCSIYSISYMKNGLCVLIGQCNFLLTFLFQISLFVLLSLPFFYITFKKIISFTKKNHLQV